jgi:aminoglycoside phosphotransferase (APT) family kinase protein
MAVRLPRVAWATDQVAKEQRWLPMLAPHLPLAIPVPLAQGEPAEGYPWHWSVYQWLEGENATLDRLANPAEAAEQLADFICALQRIDASDGPQPDQSELARGKPLATRDSCTREAIVTVRDTFDAAALAAVWDAALRAPAWPGKPVWIHGDLQSGNLLTTHGRLSAVIDFGCMALGDPAFDVMAAWLYLSAELRGVFREALRVDEPTWLRARGLALSVGLIAFPYYRETNPVLAGMARRAIDAAVADHRASR